MAWLNLNRQNRDFKANRARHEEATLKRLIQVFSSSNGVEGANPEDVEARLRNLSHGTNNQLSKDTCADTGGRKWPSAVCRAERCGCCRTDRVMRSLIPRSVCRVRHEGRKGWPLRHLQKVSFQ